MDNFVAVTAKAVKDGFNLVVVRALQIDQIEQMLASNPALGNVFSRRQLLDAGDMIVEKKLGITAIQMASLGSTPVTTPVSPSISPVSTTNVSQSDIDFVLPYMTDFVGIT